MLNYIYNRPILFYFIVMLALVISFTGEYIILLRSEISAEQYLTIQHNIDYQIHKTQLDDILEDGKITYKEFRTLPIITLDKNEIKQQIQKQVDDSQFIVQLR